MSDKIRLCGTAQWVVAFYVRTRPRAHNGIDLSLLPNGKARLSNFPNRVTALPCTLSTLPCHGSYLCHKFLVAFNCPKIRPSSTPHHHDLSALYPRSACQEQAPRIPKVGSHCVVAAWLLHGRRHTTQRSLIWPHTLTRRFSSICTTHVLCYTAVLL